jgi:hypothetical protein
MGRFVSRPAHARPLFQGAFMSQFYQHSGTVPLMGVVRTFITGFGTATFLAIIYSYGIAWIPLVYVNFLLTLALGGITGAMVTREAKGSKIRQRLVPAVIGCLCGLAGLYIAWAADLVARNGVPEGSSYLIGLNPLVLASYVEFFYSNGLWGIGRAGGNVSGLPLAAVWLVEAGIIVGLATRGPWRAYHALVFCEPCETWTTDEGNAVRLQDVHIAELVRQFEAGDFSGLSAAPVAPLEAPNFVRLNLTCCESCGDTNCLEVERVAVTVDKEGKQVEKTTILLKGLLITADEAQRVRNAGAAASDSPSDAENEVEDEEEADEQSESNDPEGETADDKSPADTPDRKA